MKQSTRERLKSAKRVVEALMTVCLVIGILLGAFAMMVGAANEEGWDRPCYPYGCGGATDAGSGTNSGIMGD